MNFSRARIDEGGTKGDGQADLSVAVVARAGYVIGAGDCALLGQSSQPRQGHGRHRALPSFSALL